MSDLISGRTSLFAAAIGLSLGAGFAMGQPAGPIHLGSGRRPKKGAPPKPTKKRATVKAARKANRARRS